MNCRDDLAPHDGMVTMYDEIDTIGTETILKNLRLSHLSPRDNDESYENLGHSSHSNF
jgi:hypothetical protein